MVGCFDQVSEESGRQGQFSDWTLNRERTSKDDACDEIQECGRSNDSYDWENEGQQAKEKLILSQAHRIVTVQNFSFLTGLRVNYENVEQFKKKTTRHSEYNETFWQANE